MSAAATPHLSDAQIVEVLGLLEGADSVELKLTVPASDQRSSIEALGFDPIDAQVRLVYFFDTPDLALSRAGVVVRARRIARKGEDSVVKLRPVVPDALPKKLRAEPGFGVEVDAMPGGFVCSGRLRVEAPSLGVAAAAAGTRLQEQARRRALAVAGRLADPRAVDEVPALRGLPGRRRDAREIDRARHLAERRAGDQDSPSFGVLLPRSRMKRSPKALT